MAQGKTVHSKNLESNRWRDLQVYYEKGSTNFWDYSQKPKGIYFASHIHTRSEGIRSWSSGQKGDGYLLIVPLERYSRKQLRLVRERVEADPEKIHALLDRGAVAEIKRILAGETPGSDTSATQAA